MIGVYSWNYGQGARNLSNEVSNGKLILRPDRTSRPFPRMFSTIVNFGNQVARPLREGQTILNTPEAVRAMSGKARQLELLKASDVRVPTYTTCKEQAKQMTELFPAVVCRTVLNGHSGQGIVIATNPDEVVDAPLYTAYIQKDQEYRVHVGSTAIGGPRIIDVRRKAKRRGLELSDTGRYVWNHGEGFVFKIEGVTPETVPRDVINQAEQALSASGLDFAAIDIVVKDGVAYVLEVNTAPSMEGSTVEHYSRYFVSRDGGPSSASWHERHL